ncbi:glycosyltransferase family 2 protein [Sphingomonas sp. 3-13AW]|uniref:glycosyltransferase family 2 protein n=1 Tax=Sphingomonas sp. 3-13AW TaxID=3050450 RepID=UPI003BB6F1A3
MPLVSVIIPTHNRSHFVVDAISSILAQTMQDVEVIVVDDGSTDDTQQRVAEVRDARVGYLRHPSNMGEAASRNTGLDAATGKYIAWLDSDDVARPRRLAVQVAYLERHAELAMVGSAAGKLRADGRRKPGRRLPPLDHELISAWLVFRSAFQQSSLTGRADVLQRYRYNGAFPVCCDVDVLQRLSRDHRLANLPQTLIDRRLHSGQMVREYHVQIRETKARMCRSRLLAIGVDPTAEEAARHALLGQANLTGVELPGDFLEWTHAWLTRLKSANEQSRALDVASFDLACAYVWALACRGGGGAAGIRELLGASLWQPLISPKALRWFCHALPSPAKLWNERALKIKSL